jgi:predicted dehydrogenase
MRIWGAEGYASLDFATKQATLIRPSEHLKRGRLDLEGVDLTQPAIVRQHLFGKVLRVDKIATDGREPLALELEDFVKAARGLSRPRVSGEDALRAVRLADRVLNCLRAHRWEAEAPPAAAASAKAPSVLRGPHAWRVRSMRQTSRTSND